MTTEQLLTRIVQLADYAKAEAPKASGLSVKIAALREEISAQLRAEIAKQTGRGNAAKILESMMKKLRDTRPGLSYPWIDDNGMQCICDGLVAYRLKNHLPLIERPADAPDPVKLQRIFPQSMADYEAVTLPDYSAVKAFIAQDKAQHRKRAAYHWNFGPKTPTVNAKYLLDIMTVLPNATEIFYQANAAGLYKPLIVKCDEGEALLCPIRVFDKPTGYSEKETEEAAAKERRQRRIDALAWQAQDKGEAADIEFDDFADLIDLLQPAAV